MAITNKQLADLMGSLTAGADNTTTLNAAYQLAFGRNADADGLAYWGNRLDNGLAVADLVEALLAGADKYPADGTFATENTADKAVIVNKTEVAEAILANPAVTNKQAETILATVKADEASKTTALDGVAAIVPAPVIDGETFVLTTGLADLEAANSTLDTFIKAIDLDENGTPDYASITALNAAVDTAEGNVATVVGAQYVGGSAAIKAQLVSAKQTVLNNTLALHEIELTEAQANVAAVTGLSAAITALENAKEVAADALTSQTAANNAYTIAQATAEAAADIKLSSAGNIVVDSTAVTGTVTYNSAVYAKINDAGKFDVVAYADATTTLTETQYNAMIDILNPLINAYNVKVDAVATTTNANAEQAYAQAVVDHLDISKAAATKLAEVGNGFTLTTPANKNLPTYDEVQDEITALIIDAASKYDTFDGALNDLYDGTNGAIDTYNSTVYTSGLTAVGPTLGTSNAIITKITANDGSSDFDVIVKNATTGLLEVDTTVVTDAAQRALLADIVTTANAYNSTLTAAVDALQASYDFAKAATAAATTGEPADLTAAIATLLTQDSLVTPPANGLYDLFVAADTANTLTTALNNAQDAIYDDNGTPDDTTDDSGSQYDINVLEELLAEEQTLINLAADAQVLVDAITTAEKAFVDAGYGEPVYLDNAKTYYATSGDDLYVVDTEVASIVRSFSTQGEDVLYIGTSHTVNTATLAATTNEATGVYTLKDAGDQSVLEVFMEQVGTDLKLYFESETYSSETATGKTPGADMTTVTLVGVSLEDITITDGMLTIA